MNCDLIIIGAGPAGYRAAEYAAQQGLRVVIFEGADVGGTCLNVGCIPTKTYVHSATFAEARQRMAQVVPQLRAGVETILSHPNVTLVRQRAAFADAHTVNGYTAPHVIIATGSETKWLPIPGLDDPRVVDSTGLLALDTLPRHLTIVGAGVIGMEFASAFRRFGSEVTVVEYLKECLPALDSDIAKRLRKTLEKRGVTFRMKTAVANIAHLDGDVILMATGRKPRTDGLNLTAAGITPAANGAIPVDDNFLALDHIYAIGDVNGRQLLAHAAEMQAVRAVNHILSRPDGIRFDVMPAAVFTTPEAASVGPSEDQLRSQGVAYECRKSFWRVNGKALAMDETEGMLKLFVTPPSEGPGGGMLLGCHAFGAHAADIVQEVAVLMCRDTTVSQLRDMVHIHPTLGEVLSSAVQ
ncbi:MAG: NAD(P)/FAD-dependent oxidoreductase [Prevotella sp.]|nr:NAD(P)/FAD-dependent oxidoreductase [Prevotella sp.]